MVRTPNESGVSSDGPRRVLPRIQLIHFQIVVLVISLLPLAASVVAANAIWRHGAYEKDLGWSADNTADLRISSGGR